MTHPRSPCCGVMTLEWKLESPDAQNRVLWCFPILKTKEVTHVLRAHGGLSALYLFPR